MWLTLKNILPNPQKILWPIQVSAHVVESVKIHIVWYFYVNHLSIVMLDYKSSQDYLGPPCKRQIGILANSLIIQLDIVNKPRNIIYDTKFKL